MGQLMDAPCVAPSRVTQKIFAVLVEWYHRIVLTMRFKLVNFFYIYWLIVVVRQCLQLYLPLDCGFELISYTYPATALCSRSTGGRWILNLRHRWVYIPQYQPHSHNLANVIMFSLVSMMNKLSRFRKWVKVKGHRRREIITGECLRL